jgi:hypothetical protein
MPSKDYHKNFQKRNLRTLRREAERLQTLADRAMDRFTNGESRSDSRAVGLLNRANEAWAALYEGMRK